MDKIRKWAETKVAKFFLGVIFLSFMSFGITGYIFGAPAKKIALTVADVDISLGSLAERVRRQKMQLQQIMGKSMPTPMLDERMLVDQIITNTTERILLDVATREMGLLATAPYILEQIKNMPEFQKDGKFSSDLFNRVLQYNGMSEKDFMAEIAGQHTRYLLRSSLESVDALPVVIVKGTLAVQKQERVVSLQEFNTASVQKDLTEADLIATYEQNKYRFIQPEFRQVSALIIKDKKDKESLLKLAEDIENEVIGGAGFDEVAKQFNVESVRFPLLDVSMTKKDGDVLKHPVISKDLFCQAFAIDEGLETTLLKIKDGFVLLRPEKVIEAMPKPFEDVKESVRRLWALKQKEMANYLKANEAL
ncbi:MAG: peptidylprolyl isomerase, partial [Alphaproteobacteria bacterium]|nr:peptidylprolyl isomerase [Alphaproteobacteria bacterium]